MPAGAVAAVATLMPLIKLGLKIGAVVAALYICFYVTLGEYTFAQHVKRIWQTDEVQELRAAIASKFTGAGAEALRELKGKLAASHDGD